ncbi:MAG: thioredoxin [Fimbriimonadales bacterium]|nr:thioredoxin [Fimbriimonadales bacterium]
MSVASPLGQAEFEDKVVNSAVPVLIDFWAEWCGPCKAIAPEVEKIAEEYAGKVNVYKVDVDSEGELAAQFGIMSIPSLLIFKGGKVVDQIVGFTNKDNIAKALERALA